MPHDNPHIQRFNESFYRSDPADYLLTRLQLVALAGAKRTELGDMLAAGIQFERFTVGPADGQPAPTDNDADFDAFLTIETQQLLHHASETVLRLFLVHSAGAEVPWVELNATRSFGKFKESVEAEFIRRKPDPKAVAYVCLGGRKAPSGTDPSEWAGAIEGLTAFLRTFAQTFLDDAPLYNAIKHGLGVSAGDAVALLDSHQMGGGSSVEFPESDGWTADDTRTWSLTTRWIDRSESMMLVAAAVHMIGSIWKIGRFRTLGGPAAGELFFPVSFRPAQFRSSTRLPMRRMSFRLLEETRTRNA